MNKQGNFLMRRRWQVVHLTHILLSIKTASRVFIQSYEVLGLHLRYQIMFLVVSKMNHTMCPSYSQTHYMLPYAYEHTPLCALDYLI